MKIFKYTPFTLNSLKTLINSEFWFGNPYKFNDPLDCIINLKITNYPDQNDIEHFYSDYNKFVPEKVNIEQKKLLFHEDKKIFDIDYKYFWDYSIQRMIGITCFSYTEKETLMWSHYADSHRGICLIFEKDKLTFTNSKVKLIDVKYSANIPQIEINAKFEKHGQIEFDFETVLTTKYERWIYEKELRAYLPYESLHTGKTIGFNIDALTGIIFGAKTSPNDISTIIAIAKYKKLTLDFYKSEMIIESGDVKIENYNI